MRPISPDLLNKLKSQEQTKANNADPRMSIQVSRARTSVMDSSYWTMETIRTKAGIGDISLAARRLKSYGRPDRIYEIHVDNGIVKTTIREYPDRKKDGWQPQFELGAGSAVAIAFDGEWELWRGNWRLKTTEKPWVMWVDGTGKLFAQLWDEVETRVELATDVVSCRAIRGWKNFSIQANDQGIVAAYIKSDGKAYYRNYCEQPDGTIAWEFERQLAEFVGTAANLNLFLTNDYRMGFVVEDSLGRVYWYITHRNWSGMAIPPEYLSAGVTDIAFDVIPIQYREAAHVESITTGISDIVFNVCPADTDPIIVRVGRLEFVNNKTITLEFNYPLESNVIALKTLISLKNDVNYSYAIESIVENGNMLTITTVEEMPVAQDITMTYSAINEYNLAFRISDNCLYDYGSTINLLIDGIPPVGHHVENLTVGLDVNFTVTQVYYSEAFASENISAGITDISFVVTKVGNNPL